MATHRILKQFSILPPQHTPVPPWLLTVYSNSSILPERHLTGSLAKWKPISSSAHSRATMATHHILEQFHLTTSAHSRATMATHHILEQFHLTTSAHSHATMATHRILEQFHLTREAFDWVIGEVEAKFNQSLVNPGEVYGTLATTISWVSSAMRRS
ncbi:uncharacterized protein F5147DRAFT_778107 [Suillus discolor]|uniref:RNA polymerase Rpb1 domain-containing protein n=1 Tax=Suillus discolor TaxID=1912936 RepID=A0A9P7EYZ4_9AGAM|nr:uncharacterized protein F5147DRAFT_778107 [Suillus discolor]KAG2096965.1 hypothetical protein F5147DRAFT_778107 [Suillus discolor]